MSVKQVVRKKLRNRAVADHPLNQLECITVEMEWDGGAWVTFIPELLNISTFGKTQEVALERTADMLLAWLDSMEENGLYIPLQKAEISKIRKALR